MKPMLLPIRTETYTDHFDDRGWVSPQSQIDAGYPYFIQPTNPTALFEQVIDVGALIPQSALVTLSVVTQDIVPGITITPTLGFSTSGTGPWTDFSSYTAFTSGFRYIKVSLAASGGGTAFLRITDGRLLVALEEIRDAGDGTASAADSSGTAVTFNKAFIDVDSITVTAKHQVAETKGITAVYDFNDVPNPTGFTVYLFSNNTGSRINGAFSWSAKGS